MVTDEVDARLLPVTRCAFQPHGRGDVAGEIGKKPIVLAGAAAVDPEMAGRAAAIALPARRVARIAADHNLATGTIGNRSCRTHRHRLYGAVGCFDVNLKDGEVALVELAVGAGKQNRSPVQTPAEHLAAAAQVGHPPGAAATRRHQIDLWHALLATHKSQPLTVRGERRVVDFAEVAGQPAGKPALAGHSPEVVLRDEDNCILVNGWEAVVAGSHR